MNRAGYVRALSMISLLGVLYLGLTTIILHLQPTGYDPVRQVVSDYAIGQYGIEMALGFCVGGIGVVSLAMVFCLSTTRRIFKIGSGLLFAAGIALTLLGTFPTDLEGVSTSVHGTIHGLLSSLVFTLGPVGMTVLSYTYGRKWLGVTIFGFIVTSIFAVIAQVLLGATGLAERGLVLYLLSWWLVASLQSFRAVSSRP